MAGDADADGADGTTMLESPTSTVTHYGGRKLSPWEVLVFSELGPHIKDGTVVPVWFHQADRGSFETQQVMEVHMLWKLKGVAHWVMRDDVDEFMQPLGAFERVVDVVRSVGTDNNGAIQVKQLFWGHMPGDKIEKASVQVWKMRWHSSGPVKGGREKLIVNTRTSDYISVHTITTGKRMYGADPQTQLRVNHYRRHFRGKGTDRYVRCARKRKRKHAQTQTQTHIRDHIHVYACNSMESWYYLDFN